ncbi:MAG: hypothetical protein RBR40_00150 [Tenuifilaceae bacterium]|nr:hypothetical protein [Tenuifilaceae bacterium]
MAAPAAVMTVQNGSSAKTTTSTPAHGEFYNVEYGNDKENKQFVKRINLQYGKYFGILSALGFQLLEPRQPYTYIRIIDNIIEEVDRSVIQNEFVNYVKKHHKPPIGIDKKQIIQLLHSGSSNYFSDSKLSFLFPENEIVYNSDTKDECYIYYRNGFVKCTPKGANFIDYKNLKGKIWKDQKNDRDFRHLGWELTNETITDGFGEWQKFIHNVCRARKKTGNNYSAEEREKSTKRLVSLYSILGYMMHHFFDYALKAVVFTDSKISVNAEGGTGKSLIGEALGKVRNRTVINGKNFKTDNQFKYQTAKRDTQIIHLNDTDDKLRVEGLFNDITDRIEVRKLHKEPFPINAKFILSANKTLSIEGDSALRRFIEFELSSYYGKDFTPEDDFKHRLFTNWDSEEWNRFDNLMAYCACYFLKYGLIAPEPINLLKRKLMENTSIEFVEFMQDRISEGQIKFNEEFCVNELFREFFDEHPNYEKHTRFRNMQDKKKCLTFFANAYESKLITKRSNSKYYGTFDRQQMTLPF